MAVTVAVVAAAESNRTRKNRKAINIEEVTC